MAIKAAWYGETVEFLRKSPIVQRMLMDLGGQSLAELTDNNGQPSWNLMCRASDEYTRLSKLNPGVVQPERMALGSVAEALVAERKATVKAFADIATDESKPAGVAMILETLRGLEAKYAERGESSGLVADVKAAGVEL